MWDHPYRSFYRKKIYYPTLGQGYGKLSKLGVGVVATSTVLAIFAFAPKTKNVAVMYLKPSVYIIIVISFHNQQKNSSKSLIPMIFGKNLKFLSIFIQNPKNLVFHEP